MCARLCPRSRRNKLELSTPNSVAHGSRSTCIDLEVQKSNWVKATRLSNAAGVGLHVYTTALGFLVWRVDAVGCHDSRLHVLLVVFVGTTVPSRRRNRPLYSALYLSSVHLLHGLAWGHSFICPHDPNIRLSRYTLFCKFCTCLKNETHDCFYARQHICYSAHMLWQFRLSVCLSVTRVDQSKMVEARITQFSPYSSPIPLVFRG